MLTFEDIPNTSNARLHDYLINGKQGKISFYIDKKFHYKKIFTGKGKGAYINFNRVSYNVANFIIDNRHKY